jgi:isocitrate/isopropylmalate dehydrogenase
MKKVLVCMNRQAAQPGYRGQKYRQPDCADPLSGAAAALQPDADDAATAIENAINRALEEGVRTGDLARGTAAVSTDEMGDIIARYVAEGV